jgi:hypothetical protein
MDDWNSSFQSFGNNLDVARRMRERERLSKIGLGGDAAFSGPAMAARDAMGNVIKAPFQILGATAQTLKGMASPLLEAFNQGFKSPSIPNKYTTSSIPELSPIPKTPHKFIYNF